MTEMLGSLRVEPAPQACCLSFTNMLDVKFYKRGHRPVGVQQVLLLHAIERLICLADDSKIRIPRHSSVSRIRSALSPSKGCTPLISPTVSTSL